MFELLQFPFMQRALIAGVILAAVLAMLGVYVLLKRMAFFADGVAHASLAGVAIGILFAWQPLTTALLVSVIFALVIYVIEKKLSLASDIAIGILFTSGMALGVLLMSLQPGYQPELISFLFGNILAIQYSELWIIAVLSIIIIGFIVLCYKQLTLLALDDDLAYVSGVKTNILQPALYVLLSMAVVVGIKLLGVVLVSALLILPAASARLITRTFKKFLLVSVVLAEITVLLGIYISFVADLPTGPVIVLVGAVLFVLALLKKSK